MQNLSTLLKEFTESELESRDKNKPSFRFFGNVF